MKPAIHEDSIEREQDPPLLERTEGGSHDSSYPSSKHLPVLPHTYSLAALQPLAKETPRQPRPAQHVLIPTIFHEDWWLDAATGGDYSFVEARADNKTVGRLPFQLRRRSGLMGIWTPPLTHFLGPGIDDSDGSSISRFLRRLEIARELICRLPQSSWQCIRCHRGTSDVISFQEQSFKTYAQFTLEIAPRPVQDLWQQMRNKTRNVIRRAQEQLRVGELEDADEFARVYEHHLTSRRIRNTLDLSAAKRLVRAALERNRGKILAARNERGEIVAANFCAWDNTSSYYVACTRNEAAGNGATSLLLWEAVQHAAQKGLVFDFAGLGTRGSVLHYAGFGGTVSTRFTAVRATGIGRLVARAKLLLMDEHFLY